MAILKRLYPLLLAAILSGCYETFTPDVDTTPVLCLNSLITAGMPINVQVTHTWMFSDLNAGKNHAVRDATVTIYVDGRPVDGNYIAREGDHVKIMADSPTYGHAEAEVTVPYGADIESVQWEISDPSYFPTEAIPGYEINTMMTFDMNSKLTLADVPDTRNFYHMSFYGYDPAVEDDEPEETKCDLYLGNLNYDSEPIFGEHIDAFETVMGSTSYGFDTFSDRSFANDKYTLQLNFSKFNYYVTSEKWDERFFDCGFMIVLSTVSESYYNWCIYTWQHNDGVLDDMAGMGFADALLPFSNVSTGAGVVAAQTQRTYTIPLDDYLERAVRNRPEPSPDF